MDTHHNTTRTPTKKGAAPIDASTNGRIAAGLREAIKLRVHDDLTIDAACAKAGISVSGYHKALLRPHVQAFLADEQRLYIQRVDTQKAKFKARAYEVAASFLAENASPADKRWAVEFFTRDDAPRRGDAPQVSVNIAQGYEFVRPGQRVVDMIDGTAPDTVSGALVGDGDGTSTG